MDKRKSRILLEVIVVLAIGFLGGYVAGAIETSKSYTDKHSNLLNDWKTREAEMDSALQMFTEYERQEVEFREVAFMKLDSLKSKLDSSYITIETLSKINVTRKDKQEALEWIEKYNSGLE